MQLPFVESILYLLKENLTTRPTIALDSVLVLIAMVSAEEDSLAQTDNGTTKPRKPAGRECK